LRKWKYVFSAIVWFFNNLAGRNLAGYAEMGATLAIIDDDEAVRDSMLFMLEERGYEVKAFDSAESFLASSLVGFDCLLVDHHMPGMTGLELLEHLRANTNDTPALMITGRADATILKRAEHICDAVLHKPVPAEVLLETIAEICPPE
jgi:FixJ family two-component response regulator